MSVRRGRQRHGDLPQGVDTTPYEHGGIRDLEALDVAQMKHRDDGSYE